MRLFLRCSVDRAAENEKRQMKQTILATRLAYHADADTIQEAMRD